MVVVKVVEVPNTSQIMVYASPEEHIEILKRLKGTDPSANSGGAVTTELIPLMVLTPADAATTLGKFTTGQSPQPVIEAQTGGGEPDGKGGASA